MSALELARWQFGITTVFHFLLVPLTIGLSFLVAIFQTAAHRTGNEAYQRMTSFFGKLFLINFGLGVVTGIVQEFQFGMNWSNYCVSVGNIFGAPLAMEGLLAFFAEWYPRSAVARRGAVSAGHRGGGPVRSAGGGSR